MTREPQPPTRETPSRPDRPRRDFELVRAVRHIMQAFDVQSRRLAGRAEVTLPQLLCLMAVVAEEGLTAKEIAARTYGSASTLVGVLDRLEAKELIDRVRDPRDRRQIHIVPTEAGRRFIADAPSPFGEHFDRRYEALPTREKHRLVEALTAMAELMTAPEG